MSQTVIRRALEKRLNLMSPALETAWENSDFTPVNAVPYQRLSLLSGTPDNPTFGGGHYRAVGLLQVTLCYPQNTGPGACQARADEVQLWFPRGLSLQDGQDVVIVERTPAIGPGFKDADRWCVPVSIRYYGEFFTP